MPGRRLLARARTGRGGADDAGTAAVTARPEVRRLRAACTAVAVLVAALVVLQWALVARVVEAVVGAGRSPAALAVPLAGALAAWWARAGLLALRDLLAARTSARVRREVGLDVVRTLVRLGPAADARAGELATTATAGVRLLDGLVARYVPGRTHATVVPLLLAAAVLVLDPPTALVLVPTGVLVVVFLWLVGLRAQGAAARQWEGLGRLGALLTDALRVLPTVVTYGRAPATVRWLADVAEGYRVATLRVLRAAFLSGFVLELGATLSTALVAMTVGVRLFEGGLGLECALLVLLLAPEFFAPLRALGADRHAALEGRPAAERIAALLALPGPPSGDVPVPAGVPEVRLEGVGVRRDGRDVLQGVDLVLPPGSRTALVGPSGAGKTTPVRLVLGYGEPGTGRVLVGGTPLPRLRRADWWAAVAHVPERPYLLPGTVADNVRLGRPDADDEQVSTALVRAGLTEVVAALPQGVRTRVGEDGATLSGGERLRLALARAFLQDTPLVVLDEPTSQLDPATEAVVLAAVADLARGRTLLTVTHRSAPTALHDRVVRLRPDGVLVDGAVAQAVP
ncbi:thiol reductant ABC exporter subunit CydD [Cellulomonas marina]|uniref:ATP-binding cassette, subfamily C, CydD/ATP-binding cassette, subfamily C, CydCD n=1 Tax=Cellulomonas marina TaxID=988821 RepID=A0A1I0V8B4_9CELL|nr:thiol reductant ABC exporter subunit CydD [Cellulomonas marina]GIG28362.1 hypothetical protein Cma02nite_09620 [Cellulomonas marina]SFA71806.1 ATP-binding cassette, subfamily C, CydD/ATP-binding cassette, subfamily C, CydCD [Cellulomonas marina]